VSLLPPVHREVTVDAEATTAFEVFTSDIGNWWPLADHGVYGPEATVAFVDGEIVERSPEGEVSVWGTVTRWEPVSALGFTWHPGRAPDRSSHVEVTFTASKTGTLVALEHTGWEVFDDPATTRAEYDALARGARPLPRRGGPARHALTGLPLAAR